MFTFNHFEVILWTLLGILFLAFSYGKYKKTLIAIATLFVLFAISDLVEIYLAIMPWWLWLWKILNFTALIGFLVAFLVSFIKQKL